MGTFFKDLKELSEQTWNLYGRCALSFVYAKGLQDEFHKFVLSEYSKKPLDKPEKV